MAEPGRPTNVHGAAPRDREGGTLAGGSRRALRSPADPGFDVFCSGTVFLDIIFTGLETPPALGTEVWTQGLGSSPGGVANLAVALSRLGLRTSLASAFGTDVYGDFCWETLEMQEGIDLSASRRFAGWHSPLTVSLAYMRDRAMITHGHAPPVSLGEMIGAPPPTRACFVEFGPEPQEWLEHARVQSPVFADVGWDPTERWAPEVLRRLGSCYAFLPNDVEAMRYTRTDSSDAALAALAEHVPLAVVTCGRRGSMAVDNEAGERAYAEGLRVPALDPTGAGDVFSAGFIVGTLAGWPLLHRLRFANLTAALSVQHFGGSLSAPCWADVVAWWQVAKATGAETASRYAFLDDLLPPAGRSTAQRATATIGFRTRG
ncbi:MAG: PfkB family carbohydrate kinase [Streptosporangiaceae bacterium]